MKVDLGEPWKCHMCFQEGRISHQQIEDARTMGAPRCPYCYEPVALKGRLKGC